MSNGLKDELGLGEPKATPQGSTKQADEFRAAFQAQKKKVDSNLQYTAAHGERTKHDPMTKVRDSSCSAYQTALSKIDPTDPSVAQAAIDQVLKAASTLAGKVQSFKDAVEKAFTAWTEKESEFDEMSNTIREMVDWGFEKANALQQVVTEVTEKVNSKQYDGALQSHTDLQMKVSPVHDEFSKQKAAKEEYDAALPGVESQLTEASVCEYGSLESVQSEMTAASDQMRQAAEAKDFVSALEQQNVVKAKLEEYQTQLAEVEAKKEEYEQARAELDPRLTEVSTSEHEWLAELDQEIADLTTKMEEAATTHDYEQALCILADLALKVDEKVRRIDEKSQYDEAREALNPRLAEASTSQHESLAKMDEQIASMTTELDQAASSHEYENALQLVGKLSSLVDEKLSEAARIDRKIIGSAQKARAESKLEAMDEKSRKRFNKLAEEASSPEELDYLTKSVAANYSIDEIEAFAKKIHGKDAEWMQNNLKLTGNSDGDGVKQQWSFSCNATTAQAVRGELDPIYALKLHEENKDLTDADNADAEKMNPDLAAEQKEMLESEYSGTSHGKHKGVATSRDNPDRKGRGRWADDLMNDMSDTTGVEYGTKKVDASYKFEDAAADVDAGVKKGHPVPLVVGNSNNDFAHYVLVTGRDDGPPPTWTIHDPGSGKTVTHSVQDIKDGNASVGGYSQITALENPTTKE